MDRVCLLAIAFLMALVFVSSGFSTIIPVPNAVATIQQGVDLAVEGDTILVAAGTYAGPGNRDIDFGGKNVTVLAEQGALLTTIDCEGSEFDQHRAFHLDNEEDSTSKIIGFTIRNGYAESGGAIYCGMLTAPTIKDCIFIHNHAEGKGGALSLNMGADSRLENCRFESNTAKLGGAAAVNDVFSLDLVFSHCEFINSSSDNGGGAVFIYFAYPTFEACTFESNSTGGNGGAILGSIASFWASDCRFIANSASGSGGCASVFESYIRVSNSLIAGNTASEGGAIHWHHPSCAKNGAESAEPIAPYLLNCTLVGNMASDSGSAVMSQFLECGDPTFERFFTLENCIVANNGITRPFACKDGANFPELTCTNVYGHTGGDFVGCIGGQDGTNGNFSAKPLFCNLPQGDYGLYNTSPCTPDYNTCGVLLGSEPIGCTSPNLVIIPQRFSVLLANTIEPTQCEILIGNLTDGHGAQDIDQSSVLVNTTIAPVITELLTGFPGFAGEVLRLEFPIADLIESYGTLFDTTEQSYSVSYSYTDQAMESFEGTVIAYGHRTGDLNDDGQLDISDLVYMVSYFFDGGPNPWHPLAADFSRDGVVDISDVVSLVAFMFPNTTPQPDQDL